MSKQHHQEQIQEEWDQETNVQRDEPSPKPQNLLLLEQQLLMKSCSTPMEATTASEREEVTGGHVHADSLESSDNSTPFSMFGSRLDDEDPIFTLDEEVQAKELFGERTRHYTADFDPTASDEDEFPKEIGNLNGGRAYSASNRFPPRVRHSGRPGILHKLHGQHGNAAGPGQMVPASLPIQISRGFVWPPRDLVENLSEEEDTSGGVDMISAKENIIIEQRERAKTIQNDTNNETSVVGEEQNHDSEREDVMYGRIRAYSRSIQPDDDPERVFGERPHRRYSSSLKYGDISVDFDLNEGSTEVANESGGENIPPLAFFNSISSSIPNSNRVSVGGTADSSSTATTPRVVMPQLS